MNSLQILKYVAFALLLFILSGCSGKQEQTETPLVAVRAVKPLTQDIATRMAYLGTIHAQSEITVIAQVQGTVQSLPLAEGSRMQQGDVLARLFAPELEAAVARLQADRDYWIKRSAGDQRLLEQKAIPPDQAEASHRASATASAAYNEVLSRLDKTTEKAAFNGFVLKWFVEPGQHVMPGQPLLMIGDAASEIRVDVVEEDLRRGLKPGLPVLIKPAAASPQRGRISEIAPLASPASRTTTVRIHWSAEDNLRLAFGSSVAVEFILQSQEQALTVPASAIVNLDGNPHLFMIRNNRALLQPVRTGIEEKGRIAVEFDWNGSDRVAVTGLNRLADSSAVFAVSAGEVTR